MFSWKGAAGICVNEKNEVLMVLQAAPEKKRNGQFHLGRLKRMKRLKNAV